MTLPPTAPSASRCAARTRLSLAAALGALCLGLAAPAAADPLDAEVRALVDRTKITGSKIGVVIADADSGQSIASVNADQQLIPASNMKVLSSGAAIQFLGADRTFDTTVLRQGNTLIIRGSGDPALGDATLLKEMNIGVEDLLRAWTDAVRKDNAGPIAEVVIDDRIFDREFVHPSWPTDQLNRWYCAEVAGFNFHANVLAVFPRPTRPGEAPAVSLEPAARFIELANRATTKTTGSNALGVRRSVTGNALTLHGEIRWTPEEPVEVAVHTAPMFFGRVIGERVADAGLGVPRVRLADPADDFSRARILAVVRSPMNVILRRCNVNSYNLYADALMKRMGHEVTGQQGSWSAGSAVLRMAVQQRLGPADASQIVVADGSGMSRENRVTAGVLARWLASFHKDAVSGPAFIESLPVAQRDGSLRSRFPGKKLELEIRAKTGFIRNVSTLSGYITDPRSGRRLVFSVLVNDFPAKVGLRPVRDFQDAVAMLAHDWLLEEVRPPELGG